MSPKNFCEAQARAWRKEGVGGRNSATPERSAERSEAVMSDFAFLICGLGSARLFQKFVGLIYREPSFIFGICCLAASRLGTRPAGAES